MFDDFEKQAIEYDLRMMYANDAEAYEYDCYRNGIEPYTEEEIVPEEYEDWLRFCVTGQ